MYQKQTNTKKDDSQILNRSKVNTSTENVPKVNIIPSGTVALAP